MFTLDRLPLLLLRKKLVLQLQSKHVTKCTETLSPPPIQFSLTLLNLLPYSTGCPLELRLLIHLMKWQIHQYGNKKSAMISHLCPENKLVEFFFLNNIPREAFEKDCHVYKSVICRRPLRVLKTKLILRCLSCFILIKWHLI